MTASRKEPGNAKGPRDGRSRGPCVVVRRQGLEPRPAGQELEQGVLFGGARSAGEPVLVRTHPQTVSLALLHVPLPELLELTTVLRLAGLFLDLLRGLLSLGALGEVLGPLDQGCHRSL